ncbi:MAG: PAS domain S-box protein, partial [Candidatus Brocadiaceae bacterium]|nr:PAS domain S-box protein [Candidatus Brocadiaceae bacterium]
CLLSFCVNATIFLLPSIVSSFESNPDYSYYRVTYDEDKRIVVRHCNGILTKGQGLRESEEHYRLLVDSVRDYAIFKITPEGIIETWNEGVKAIKGYDAADVIGKHISIFYPEEDIKAGKIEHELQKAKENGEYEDEGWRVRKDGSRFWANVVITAIHDDSGNISGFTKVTRDITERMIDQERLVEYQVNLERANAKLKELDQLKSMFLASMSHELRTPLNSIIGFTGIIIQGLDGEINSIQRDHLGRANRSAKHLLSLINDVIDLSKIEAGMVEVFLEDVSLNDIIHETVSWVQSQADVKGLTMHIIMEPGLRIKTDRKRVYQCVLNYLSNAVKFTETGTITVSVIDNGTNGEVEINVSDTGIGILKEDQQKLFKPFERINSHLRTVVLGTGLGLYLTKKLTTELLEGTVDVQSQLGEGSRFTLRLPKEIKKR